jgi:hypothetical protein
MYKTAAIIQETATDKTSYMVAQTATMMKFPSLSEDAAQVCGWSHALLPSRGEGYVYCALITSMQNEERPFSSAVLGHCVW